MELIAKKSVDIPDGEHAGVIVRIEYREEPYKYTDVIIKDDISGMELSYGCPTNPNTNGKLMRLLSEFTEIIPGKPYDPEKVLLGKDVKLMTIKVKKNDKEYVRIVDDSIKQLTS